MTDESAPIEQLPPYRLEGARSSRSSCKACRKKIEKGALRLGVMIEGPFGSGYLWYHLKCAAKRRIEDVEAAYAEKAWDAGVEVPPIEELRKLAAETAEEKKNKKQAPWVEIAPSARSKCKQCGEGIEEGAPRVVILRAVEFGNQVRNGPIAVHPRCVAAALQAPDSATEAAGLRAALRANSTDIDPKALERALSELGAVDAG
ncbi:MAG TPA: hypothetical protein VK843_03630 [Planctomycetota bacterium]|nr:hypothetical protein [Planctomycetota bacterium]